MGNKKRKVIYPVKIGYSDKSGRSENYITDSKDYAIVRGWGDCCQIGGIHDKGVAKAIVRLLNEYQPIIYVRCE